MAPAHEIGPDRHLCGLHAALHGAEQRNRCQRCGGALPVSGRLDATGECVCHETDTEGYRIGDVGHPGDPGLF